MGFYPPNLKAVVHYICRRKALEPKKLGAVKLQKILWYLDIRSYRITGEPLTGASFVKRQFGPFSQLVEDAIKELSKEGKLTARTVEFFDYDKRELIGLGSPSVSHLEARQIRWIDEVTDSICDGHTAESISEKSHDQIWKTAEMYEPLPISAAAIRFVKPDEESIAWARTELGLA